MKLHREGRTTILFITLACGLAVISAWSWMPPAGFWLVAMAMACLLGLVLWFFRTPRRPPVGDDAAVLSPCDGRVVVVEQVQETEYFQGKRLQVSIFMSPLNVHVNYHPLNGTTVYRKYHPGKYLVAWHPKSSTDNERSTIVVKHDRLGEVLIRQIAGALARRIRTYPVPGDAVVQGSELGFIKFGSRVDLFLPPDCKVEVQVGQTVTGATTVIARL